MKAFLTPIISFTLLIFCLQTSKSQSVTITDTGGCFSSFTLTLSGTFNGKNYYANGARALSLYWDNSDNRWEVDGSSATPGQNVFVVWVSSVNTPLNPPDLNLGAWTDASGFCGTLIQMDGDGTTLPVELISFEAYTSQRSIIISWQTAMEANNLKFEIEESSDGIRFSKIGETQGNGTTNDLQAYTFSVPNPRIGNTYYRLKQIDYNGQFEYSKVISSQLLGQNRPTGELYPNPSNSGLVRLDYMSQNNQEIIVSIIRETGELLAHKIKPVSKGKNIIDLDFSDLNSGIYFVKLGNQQNTIYRKFIIK